MKTTNRWIYPVIGTVALFFAGVVYSWSVLSGPIAAEFPQWSNTQLSLTFTIVMIFFCIGCIAGGFFSEKISAKLYLITAGILFGAGFFLASNAQTYLGLYFGFGILCGIASGLTYSTSMSTVGKWFPDKPGFVAGILLMGFGISSFLIGKLFQTYTPEFIGAWRSSFVVLGCVSFAVLILCALFMQSPAKDFYAVPSSKKRKCYIDSAAEEVTTKTMLKRPVFWLYYLWAILLSAAGLALVSQASSIAREAGPDILPNMLATIVGLISVFNGLGRVIMGALFDKFGRSFVMQTVNILFISAAVVLLMALSFGSKRLIIVGFILGGLAYGGVTPTNSAFISSYFGFKNYPLNFSMINTNLLIASFGSTAAGALYDATHSFIHTCFLICGASCMGILISITISILDERRTSMS